MADRTQKKKASYLFYMALRAELEGEFSCQPSAFSCQFESGNVLKPCGRLISA